MSTYNQNNQSQIRAIKAIGFNEQTINSLSSSLSQKNKYDLNAELINKDRPLSFLVKNFVNKKSGR